MKTRMAHRALFILLALLGALAHGPAGATALPAAFTYQGRLLAGGAPVTGTYDMQFTLYDAQSGGAVIGMVVAKTNVPVANGLCTVELNFGWVFTGTDCWLQVDVRPSGGMSYSSLGPRQHLTAAPYALTAMQLALPADLTGANDSQALVEVTNTGANGIGLYSSGKLYGVEGYSNSSSGMGLYGYGAGASGRGVYGYAPSASGTTYGAVGRAVSTSGTGLWGDAGAASGTTKGVYGTVASPNGYGVYGSASAGGIGVYGISSTGNAGKFVITNAGNNQPALYVSTAGSGEGVSVSSQSGTAVTGTSATGMGVWGFTQSSYACAVIGDNTAGGEAVVGRTTSDTAGAVVGRNDGNSYGVRGFSTAAGVGVYGTSVTGTGGKFQATTSGVGVYARSASGNIIEGYGSDAGNRRFYVSNGGNVYCDGAFTGGGADFAELLPAQAALEPGDVLVIGADGALARSTQAFQPTVVGVYSTKPGFLGGTDEGAAPAGTAPLAVVGVVPVKASAENGAITPGDLLVASATPGHAMRAGAAPPVGTVIGKALTRLNAGAGVITMLVISH